MAFMGELEKALLDWSEPASRFMVGEGAALPMQQGAWLRCAAAHFAPGSHTRDGALEVFKFSDARAVPMVRTPGAVPRLTLPGAAQTGEPGDLVWVDEASLHDMAGQLARQALPVVLPRVPADSPSIRALQRAFRGRGWVRTSAAPGAPYIDLDESWAEPQSKFNSGRRSDFRRAERHAHKQGGLSFETHRRLDPVALDRLLDEAYDVEARSWKGQEGSALALHGTLGPFFRSYAHAAMRDGLLRLAFMRVGGVAVGMQIAVQWRRSLWLLKIGYDPAYARCGPGNLLMLHTIGEAAREGLRTYEFLGTAAPWTAQWTSTLRRHVRLNIYPWSLVGARALAEDAGGYLQHRRVRGQATPAPTLAQPAP